MPHEITELTKSLYVSKMKCGTGIERMAGKGRLSGKSVHPACTRRTTWAKLTWLKGRKNKRKGAARAKKTRTSLGES